MLTLVANISAMVVAYYLVLAYADATASASAKAGWPAPAMDLRLLIAVVLILAQLMIVTAVALFFSTFSSPLLATLLTLGLWVAGHFNADLRNFGAVVDSAPAAALARGLYYLLPNLAPFDVKAEVVHGVPIAGAHIGLTLAYAGVYITMLLVAAVMVFRRRDFK